MRLIGIVTLIGFLVVALNCKVTEGILEPNYVTRVSNHSSQPAARHSGYHHVWPEMKFGWKIFVGGMIAFLGSALGSVGGVGADVFFMPVLILIVGFDPKSATAVSKCMIFGGSAVIVFYNLGKKHPTIGSPIMDYDLALVFQPMLIMGISIGVALNVLLAEWMITLLLIIVFLGLAIRTFRKAIKTWKNETMMKNETTNRAQRYREPNTGNNDKEVAINNSNNPTEIVESKRMKVSVFKNVCRKELGLLMALWIIILALQIAKTYTRSCSLPYWILNFSQIPVTAGVTLYESISLYKGWRIIASKGEANAVANYRVRQLVAYSALGVLTGAITGLLGVGGGVILSPVFLDLGIPPEVSSATTILIMAFSSSISVVEYYLLKQFPVPFALCFAALSTISAILGKTVVGKVIRRSGRASVIIFVMASMAVVGAVALGGVGVASAIEKIQRNEYMGLGNICASTA